VQRNGIARVALFGVAMCLLGAGLTYVFIAYGARIFGDGGVLHVGPPSFSAFARNGPPCMDEEDTRPGQPKPYCGDLASLAAVNIREAKLEKIAKGFDRPWAFEFINANELLITEFSGHLKQLFIDTGKSVDIAGLPDIVTGKGQAGLLDVALHPDFKSNNQLYFSYVVHDGEKDARYALAVARASLVGNKLESVERIFVATPYNRSASNFGGALLFDRNGYLLIATGERSIRSNAQHPGQLTGKIIRLKADGSVPDDNPFAVSGEFTNPAIYALGVRNPQGLVLDPVSGNVYEAEHGPMGGDEVNLIRPGKNYGWPIITYGLNYTYAPIGEGGAREGLEQPLFYYLPSIAISPIEIYRGDMFAEWDGDLLVGALKGEVISKLDLVDGRVESEYQILGELKAKVRDIKVAPDSSLWILLETGAIYRLSREASPVQEKMAVGEREGETIYLTVCSSCHSQNAPGAPQLANKSDWVSRLKKDRKALYDTTMQGKNGMPEKGFCEDCTREEIIRTVNFMVNQVNGE